MSPVVGIMMVYVPVRINNTSDKLTCKMQRTILKPAIYGAYSELYAALSPELKEENNGGYLLPWGRIGEMQEDIAKGLKSKSEGGTGTAARFIEYCNRKTESFL